MLPKTPTDRKSTNVSCLPETIALRDEYAALISAEKGCTVGKIEALNLAMREAVEAAKARAKAEGGGT